MFTLHTLCFSGPTNPSQLFSACSTRGVKSKTPQPLYAPGTMVQNDVANI